MQVELQSDWLKWYVDAINEDKKGSLKDYNFKHYPLKTST